MRDPPRDGEGDRARQRVVEGLRWTPCQPLHHAGHGPPPRPGEDLRRLDETTFVAPRQIVPTDVPGLAACGIRLLINNRPDGEEPGQPSSAEMAEAAGAAGLLYRHIPVAGPFSAGQIEAMAEAMDGGPALAFCRTGTRSTWLWALARLARGEKAETLIAKASAAGYDLSALARAAPGPQGDAPPAHDPLRRP